MGDVRQVLTQLRTLASEPEHREYILSDRTCFAGLIKFLDNSDHEVVTSALEVLQILCGNAPNSKQSNPNSLNANRQQMANDMELISRMKKLMFDFKLPTPAKKLAGNIYATLQKYMTVDKVPMNPTEPVHSNPLRDTTNTPPASSSGLSFFSEKANTAINAARTYTFYIKSLNTDANRTQIESQLITVKGIISFSLDTRSHRATIRSSLSSSDILNSLKTSGVKDASLFPIDSNGNAVQNENEPQYLPEPNQSGWFSSIITWGSHDDAQKTQKTKQPQQAGGFFSRFNVF